MTRAAPFLGALVVLLFAVPALAGEVTVGAFAGPGAPAVKAQLTDQLCAQVDCVAAPKGKKAKKKVPPVLTGKVVKAKKKTELTLTLTTAGKQTWKKTYLMAAGKLTDDGLEKAVAQVVKTVGAKAPPPPPPPEPKPEPVTTTTTPTTTTTAAATDEKKPGGDDWAQKTDDGSKKDPEKTAATEPEAAVSEETTAQQPTIFLSVNLDLLSRGFSYDGLTTANLHEYKGFPIAAPHVHADLYPLARLTQGWLGGLGLEADFAFTLGLKAVAGSVDYPSSIMRFAGALKFRIPLTSGGIAIVPAVGFNYTSFTVSAAKDNSELAGLPDVAYMGMRVGAGLDAPLLDQKLRLCLGVAYLPVFSAGEVISSTYFPEGSVWGIGVNASAGYRVISPLEIRLAFSLENYGLSFKSLASDAYQAKGASDLLWSLSLGLGFVW